MSYYTYYSIEFYNQSGSLSREEIDAVWEKLEEIVGEEFDSYSGSYATYESSWYDHDQDMCTISMCFPDYTFDVHGDGEAGDDIWDCTWRNGRYHHRPCEIPPFDESELREYNKPKEEFLPPKIINLSLEGVV